jgi:hypothetical protein
MDLYINEILTIIGKRASVEYGDLFEKNCIKNKKIRFNGYVKPTDHYENIHILIIPSLWDEALNMVAFIQNKHEKW